MGLVLRSVGVVEAAPEGAREELSPASLDSGLEGLPVVAVEVQNARDGSLVAGVKLSIQSGERFAVAAARRAARELLDSGRFAGIDIALEHGRTSGLEGVKLTFRVVERRLIASVRIDGGGLDEAETRRFAELSVGREIAQGGEKAAEGRIVQFYAEHGFLDARASIELRPTDDPTTVSLSVTVVPATRDRIVQRVFVSPPLRARAASLSPVDIAKLEGELSDLQRGYALKEGDTFTEDAAASADLDLQERFRSSGFHRAVVGHGVVRRGGATYLYVRIDPGPKISTRYEGLLAFDADALDDALDLARESDKGIGHLEAKLRQFYQQRGFLDVEVAGEERGGGIPFHDLYFRIREHEQVRIGRRSLPCLIGGPLSVGEALAELDAVLAEELPDNDVGGGDPTTVNRMIDPSRNISPTRRPLSLKPSGTPYVDSYERAAKHLQDYFRSQGYLSATIGPVQLLRRQCSPMSPPGGCSPIASVVHASGASVPFADSSCRFDAQGVPIDEPPVDRHASCVPDPLRGVRCEPIVEVRVPVKIGPQTRLSELAFEGNRALLEGELGHVAGLELGGPVSQVEVEQARLRVLDALREEGFAFADVRALLETSPDRTRAKLRFIVSEAERVVVDRIVLRGASRTDPDLIVGRLLFHECQPETPIEKCSLYRVSDVRKSEERLATLGVFTSVSIGLLEPEVPARRKSLLVEVQERIPQYTELRAGFSTGEGFRGLIEYGHRNVGGSAVQLVLRSQLSYLPLLDLFILDPDVVRNYQRLSVSERLERRNTISLIFPQVGLGPLIRLGVDGFDVRDNSRDFGLSKEALGITLTHRPMRSYFTQLGASLERNDVRIFNGSSVDSYVQSLASSSDVRRLLRVPDGTTLTLSQRLAATWDRRDNSFGASRGTFLNGAVEHVHALVPDTGAVMSDFLRITGTISGYVPVPLWKRKLVIAATLRAGRTIQLFSASQTYPDRLFFQGGVDSLRGFLQDSLVPEDVSARLLDPANLAKADGDPTKLSIDKIAIRGGNVFVNPRVELRFPVASIFDAGIFLDTGNVWVDPAHFEPFRLRYASGIGVRVGTPIGPIALDYGINLQPRPWEQFGAFHFSIGLF